MSLGLDFGGGCPPSSESGGGGEAAPPASLVLPPMSIVYGYTKCRVSSLSSAKWHMQLGSVKCRPRSLRRGVVPGMNFLFSKHNAIEFKGHTLWNPSPHPMGVV